MIQRLQRRFALSRKGAVDTIKGSIFCALQNISFMIPVMLLYLLAKELLSGTPLKAHLGFYIVASILCGIGIVVCTRLEYDGTFLATYVETGIRRVHLAETLRKLPLSFFHKKDLADLTSSIMNDCAVLETSQSHFVAPLLGSLLSTIGISISLFFLQWQMAFAAVWVVPVACGILFFSSRVQKQLSKKSLSEKIACEEGIQECLETMQDLRANHAEGRYLQQVEAQLRSMEHRMVIAEFGTASFIVSASLVLRLGIATTALVGSYLLMQRTIDIPMFFLFLFVASQLYDPLEGALQNLSAIIATNSNIERMNEILDHPIQTGVEQLTNDGYDIVFDHVGFAYNSGQMVLKDVSFIAKQGEVTALVGPSGGGKTTISRLVARFWDLPQGSITVGGMDISKIDPETLLSLYAIVFQDVTLFNDTVMENIRIGRKDATDEEVLAAAKLANVDTFVEKLPQQWETPIGENGCALSGGERQRISIARAFLKDAPIILLDEATASLDVENETAIQKAISKLIQNKTVLMIAHRMRTVSSADKIVVLKDGMVAEQGRPEELLRSDGFYSHMIQLQVQSKALEG